MSAKKMKASDLFSISDDQISKLVDAEDVMMTLQNESCELCAENFQAGNLYDCLCKYRDALRGTANLIDDILKVQVSELDRLF